MDAAWPTQYVCIGEETYWRRTRVAMSDGSEMTAEWNVGTCLTCIYQNTTKLKKDVRTALPRLSSWVGGTHCIIDG